MPVISTALSMQGGRLHRLDPRVKGLWALLLTVLLIVSSDPLVMTSLVAILFLAVAISQLGPRVFLGPLRAVLPLIIGVFLLQVLLRHEGSVVAFLGPLQIHATALEIALLVSLRIIGLALTFMLFTMTTSPTDVGLMLVSIGVPYRYAFMVTLTFRFLPVMEEEMVNIFESQQARGLELSGTFRKIRHLPRIILPFLLRTARRAKEIALTMELRAFDYRPRRTYLHFPVLRRWDYAGLALALVPVLIAVFLPAVA